MKSPGKITSLGMVVVLILLTSLSFGFRNSQNAVRAKWTAYVIHTADGQADIHFKADIPGGWRMYSQNMTNTDGPLPTSIDFDPNPSYSVVGSPIESGKYTSFYQPELGMEVNCLEGTANYVQHITYSEKTTFAIKCMINYMLNRDGEILPPDDEDFTITVEP
ncbi:MAG TPA: hypothetical protein VFU15_14480 [Bacteroidia bacterium]|nr:hypothetical protein [Bacteroidia bacterium]